MLATAVARIRTFDHRAPACSLRSGSPDAAGRRTLTHRRPFNGRLYRARRVSDLYRGAGALSRGISLLFVLVLAGVFLPSARASATTIPPNSCAAMGYAFACPDEATAKAGAQAYADYRNGTNPGITPPFYIRRLSSPTPGFDAWQECRDFSGTCDQDSLKYYFPHSDPVPENPCRSGNVPHFKMAYAGKVLKGMSTCVPSNPDSAGATTKCAATLTPLAPPTMNQWGSWSTYGDLQPSGEVCGSAGESGWSNADGTPNTQAPAPTLPATGTQPPAPPKQCGGGSCYDPGSDQFCGVGTGGQFCVPGGNARGDEGGSNAGTPSGSPAGACATSGDSSLCAGTPDAPLPPATANPDPSSSLNGRDSYTQANPTTGTPVTVVVTTYTNPGATPTTSGQGTGDTGPAPASSTGGDGCTAGSLCRDAYAAAPCGADPVTQGDPLLGAAVTELHRIRCATGDSLNASDFDGADRSLGDQTASPDHVFSEGDDAGSPGGGGPLDALDSAGFLGGPRSCPGFRPVMMAGVDLMGDASTAVCQGGSMLAGFVLACAYALAALIIYRGKAS